MGSSSSNQGSLMGFIVLSGHKPIDSCIEVISIKTWLGVNKVPKAQLVMFDGSAALSDFEHANSDTFLPGKKIELMVGYGTTEQSSIFSGVVIKHKIGIDGNNGPTLTVDIAHKAIAMTLERKSVQFEAVTDSELFKKLISAHKLTPTVSATTTKHAEIVQYHSTDWDLMVMRAELNSALVIVDNDTVSVENPNTAQKPALSVKYGDSIIDLQLELDALNPYDSKLVKSYSWDYEQQKLIESGPGKDIVEDKGDLQHQAFNNLFKLKNLPQQTAGALDLKSLKDWSSARLMRAKLARVSGTVSFKGNASAKVGKTIELAGVGKSFNGLYFISAVDHIVNNGKWITRVAVGLSSKSFAATAAHIAAQDAAGQLPPIKGLHTGIVKKIKNPDNEECRVWVNLPLLRDKKQGLWVRLANAYASVGVGALFIPEIEDEVVIGFMNEDPRYGIILGSLYSKKRHTPFKTNEKNHTKGFKTKSGLEITFDDNDRIIQLLTPDQQSIILDDKAKSVVIKDSHKNSITLSKNGISLNSDSVIKLKAKGKIELAGERNITLGAATKVAINGDTIEHVAKKGFVAKGKTTLLKASRNTTIKGSRVKIN